MYVYFVPARLRPYLYHNTLHALSNLCAQHAYILLPYVQVNPGQRRNALNNIGTWYCPHISHLVRKDRAAFLAGMSSKSKESTMKVSLPVVTTRNRSVCGFLMPLAPILPPQLSTRTSHEQAIGHSYSSISGFALLLPSHHKHN